MKVSSYSTQSLRVEKLLFHARTVTLEQHYKCVRLVFSKRYVEYLMLPDEQGVI
jgi:hypothetical protein